MNLIPPLLIWAGCCASPLVAQNLMQMIKKHELTAEFDLDKNGRLDDDERAKARTAIRERRRSNRGVTRVSAMPKPSEKSPILPRDIEKTTKRSLFDPHCLHTLFLYLPQADWHEELMDFWKTDVEVPGSVVFNRRLYKGVGVRFRGTSSYLYALSTRKKSLNIAFDHTHRKQRIGGQRTLNLLNAVGDRTLLREVLMSRVSSEFVPTMRVNLVRVVINGEDLGVYGNGQQFNTDFLDDAFGSRKGVRWKIRRNSRGVGALRFLGDNPKLYTPYELKTEKDKEALGRLIELCRVLDRTPPAELPAKLPPLLDVDGALWFVALENVFLDTDGYVRQGYDYRLVEDRHGRFHPIPYDGNEAMTAASTSRQAVAMARSRGQIVFGLNTSPLAQADNPQRPLVHRLLAVPEWRARYLAHVRTLALEWLDWRRFGALARDYHDLIDRVVKASASSPDAYSVFDKSLDVDQTVGRRTVRSLRHVITKRREFLLGHEALQGDWPSIRDVRHEILAGVEGKRGVRVQARVDDAVPVERVILYTSPKRNRAYTATAMKKAASGAWVGESPAFEVGKTMYYYVEARTAQPMRTTFSPAKAESGATKVKIEREGQ